MRMNVRVVTLFVGEMIADESVHTFLSQKLRLAYRALIVQAVILNEVLMPLWFS